MKFFTAVIVILFSFSLEFAALSHVTEIYSTPEPPPTARTTLPPETSSLQNAHLDNYSTQEVLSSDIDASEKIEKKIITSFKQYASNFGTYKKIRLSTEGFTFPKRSIVVGLGWANAIFYNIRVFESSIDSSGGKSSYSSLIGCDSTRTAKVEIKLPKDIEIAADIKVNEISDTPSEFQSPSDILYTGSIFVTLKNTSISNKYSTQTDKFVNNTSKLFYSKSMVFLDIATNVQMQIYNILGTFFDEAEYPLRQFLIQKLDAELTKKGISPADECSKFINNEKSSNKANLPISNNNLNDLYVIPNTKLEMWKGVSISAGPILIDGLASFNSTELVIPMENEASSESYYYYRHSSTPRYNNPMNKMTVRIKTNDLKGKVDWSYNSKQRSVSFILEFIQFEMKKSDTSQDESRTENYRRYSSTGRPRSRYYRDAWSNNKKIDNIISLHLGNIQIESSKSSTCEKESEFVNFVLSEYLKAVIADSLKNSLDKKVQNESLFVDSD